MPPESSLAAIVATIASTGVVAGCVAWLRNNALSIRAGRLRITWAGPKR
jgi:hypothetical protein